MNAPAPARLASTIMLVRDGAQGMEVFMVVRHHQIDFASGALVFPGGSLDADDHAIAADPALYRDAPGLDAATRAVRVAAVRETHEECGVLLARARGSQNLVNHEVCDAVASKLSAGASFRQAVAESGLELALDMLTPFAHWITPTFMPKRFDTYFFVVAAPVDQLAQHDGSESVDSTWINAAQALKDAEAGKYTIIFPTRLNLALLAKQNDVAAAIAAARARKIVTVEPIPAKLEGGGRALKIPVEAGYGGDIFPAE